MSEIHIQQAIRLELGKLPDLVLWRNSTGVTQDEERKRRYGLCVGSADLVGILRMPLVVAGVDGASIGRWIALEVKSARGRTSPEQDKFLSLVRRMGGFAAVVRSVGEAIAAIERARAGASE